MATDENIRATVEALIREVTATKQAIQDGDTSKRSALAEAQLKLDQAVARTSEGMARLNEGHRSLSSAVERLSAKVNRPGGGGGFDAGATSLRESARGLLEAKFFNSVTKGNDIKFAPTEDELAEAEHAVMAMKHLLKCTSLDQLPAIEKNRCPVSTSATPAF